MFSLLPEAEKKAIVTEYKVRVFAVALFFIFALEIIFSVVLVPSLFLSNQKSIYATIQFDEAQKDSKDIKKDDSSSIISLFKEKLAALEKLDNPYYIHEIISAIVSIKGSDITITGIDVSVSSAGRSVNLKGKARDRAALLAFKGTLSADKDFSKVDVPVSNFAQAKNIDFSIVIKTK